MNDHRACTGCAVCILPCPVWRETRDLSLTVAGRARSLQGGAVVADLRAALQACVLCGACEVVCPEEIATVGMTLALRASSPLEFPVAPAPGGGRKGTFFPGASLLGHRLYETVLQRLGATPVDATDLSSAIEAGRPVSPDRLRERLDGTEVVVDDGILHRPLRSLGCRVIGLGEALLRKGPALLPTDLYVIETRCYHADFRRLVRLYDDLRRRVGCAMNLDLQCTAMATGAASQQARAGNCVVDAAQQARWILEGRDVKRIVVEGVEDMEPLEKVSGLPVVHLVEITP